MFGGGFNVGINVKADKTVYNDQCVQVTEMLDMFSKIPAKILLQDIDNLINRYELSKENAFGFLTLRTDYNKSVSKHPIVLYTLICHAFNNQIRFNSKQEYNMPFGKDRSSFNPALREKFIKFVDELHKKEISFVSHDFNELNLNTLNKNDFVYCDPPYFNTVAAYNENGGWTVVNENALRNTLITLNKQGVRWALSNNLKPNTTLKKWAEDNGFKIHFINGTYSNCNYQKKDKQPDIEVLITNY